MIQRPQGVTLFRGYAGESAVGFFRNLPFLSILGISLVYILIFFLFSKPSEKIPELLYALPLVLLILHSFFASRFALSSQKGHFQEGLTTDSAAMEDSIGYTFRLVFASLVYLVPGAVMLFILFQAKIEKAMMMFTQVQLGAETTGGVGIFLLLGLSCLVFGVMVYLAPISHLVALTTESALDTWSPSQWTYFLTHRKEDTMFFNAVVFGSLMCASILFGVVLLSIALITLPMFKSASFLSFLYSIYGVFTLSSYTILAGRLSGACIFGNHAIGDNTEDSEPQESSISSYQTTSIPTIKSSPNPPSTSTTPQPVSASSQYTKQYNTQYSAPAPTHSLTELKAEAEALLDNDLDAALAKVQEIQQLWPHDLRGKALLVKILTRQDKLQEALEVAQESIPRAFHKGASILAIEIYLALDKSRLKLNLSAENYQTLANFLKQEEHFRDSVWCFYQYGKLASDLNEAERLVLEVAKFVEQQHNSKKALPLYRFILKYFPETTHRGYIEKVIEFNKSQ